jgi:hypothetical protein
LRTINRSRHVTKFFIVFTINQIIANRNYRKTPWEKEKESTTKLLEAHKAQQ